jgi:hypothetical protein
MKRMNKIWEMKLKIVQLKISSFLWKKGLLAMVKI